MGAVPIDPGGNLDDRVVRHVREGAIVAHVDDLDVASPVVERRDQLCRGLAVEGAAAVGEERRASRRDGDPCTSRGAGFSMSMTLLRPGPVAIALLIREDLLELGSSSEGSRTGSPRAPGRDRAADPQVLRELVEITVSSSSCSRSSGRRRGWARSHVRWLSPTWLELRRGSRADPEALQAKRRWKPIATLHRPIARCPSSRSAWLTIPSGIREVDDPVAGGCAAGGARR